MSKSQISYQPRIYDLCPVQGTVWTSVRDRRSARVVGGCVVQLGLTLTAEFPFYNRDNTIMVTVNNIERTLALNMIWGICPIVLTSCHTRARMVRCRLEESCFCSLHHCWTGSFPSTTSQTEGPCCGHIR